MKTHKSGPVGLLCGTFLCILLVPAHVALAEDTAEGTSGSGAGVADYVAPTEEEIKQQIELCRQEAEKNTSTLVMANVKVALNVRAEADENSEKLGILYKDCGGTILERKDGWTKLQSGDLVGWASDEYLLFNEEAEALADEVGNLIVNIETDSLRVRKAPNLNAGIYGFLSEEDELDVIEVVNDDWISVQYEGEAGYVASEYVSIQYHIDCGETMEVIEERERKLAEERSKRIVNQGAVMASEDETRLLGALIQCEAGNQPAEGMLAVGAVVMNRVRSPGYPNDIAGVIFASGQFTPALNGKVAKVYESGVRQSCMDAAVRALAGESNVGTATHFKRVGSHDGIVIGAHVFW